MADDLNLLSDEDFRQRLRAWLETNSPAEWRDPSMRLRGDDARWWQKKLHDAGWRAPSWPKEHGGLGLSLGKQIIYQQEMERAGVARTLDQGVRMVGPILIRFGTPEQQAAYLPPMLTGEHQWCQGYSEPNAGSDLANLKTKAVRVDDHYVLNGQKIWTTQAGDSSHIYVLARTATLAKKQQGITLFLLDMKTPGLDIRPIRNLADEDEFYEVFFDDVVVPLENVVGEVDKGWGIAKALLGFERFSQGSPLLARFAMKVATELSTRLGLADDVRYGDRLARLACDLHDANALFDSLCDAVERGEDPQQEYSIAKMASAELFQRIGDCLADLAGEPDPAGEIVPAELRADAERLFIIARPVTIFGGTSEIQRNILAKTMLPA